FMSQVCLCANASAVSKWPRKRCCLSFQRPDGTVGTPTLSNCVKVDRRELGRPFLLSGANHLQSLAPFNEGPQRVDCSSDLHPSAQVGDDGGEIIGRPPALGP